MRVPRIQFKLRSLLITLVVLATIFAAYLAGRREAAGVRTIMVIQNSADGTPSDYLQYMIR